MSSEADDVVAFAPNRGRAGSPGDRARRAPDNLAAQDFLAIGAPCRSRAQTARQRRTDGQLHVRRRRGQRRTDGRRTAGKNRRPRNLLHRVRLDRAKRLRLPPASVARACANSIFRGHEIGLHGHAHRPAGAFSAQDFRDDLQKNRDWLEAIDEGVRPTNFAYPYGLASFASQTPALRTGRLQPQHRAGSHGRRLRSAVSALRRTGGSTADAERARLLSRRRGPDDRLADLLLATTLRTGRVHMAARRGCSSARWTARRRAASKSSRSPPGFERSRAVGEADAFGEPGNPMETFVAQQS